MKDKPTVYMVQIMPQLWRIESKSGAILQDDIRCYSLQDAEKLVKMYISSWSCWRYELKPLETK